MCAYPKAVDGNEETWWSSGAAAPGPWWQINFSEPTLVNQVFQSYPTESAIYNADVLGSNNGVDFNLLLDDVDFLGTPTTHTFDSIANYQYYRIRFNTSNTWANWVGIGEIQFQYDDEAVSSSEIWSHKRTITVSNNNTFDLADATFEIILPFSAEMKPDFSDIRFTNSSDELLQYEIVSVAAPDTATFRIKIESIASGETQTVSIYSGNPNATALEYDLQTPDDITQNALVITAQGVNSDDLSALGINAVDIGGNVYLVPTGDDAYLSMFIDESPTEAPATLLEKLENYFDTPSNIQCSECTASVAHASRGTSHASSSAALANVQSTPITSFSTHVQYLNYKWSGSYYDPNWIVDSTNSIHIYNNDTSGSHGDGANDPAFSSSVYRATTGRIESHMNYGYAQLFAVSFNSVLTAGASGGSYGSAKVYSIPEVNGLLQTVNVSALNEPPESGQFILTGVVSSDPLQVASVNLDPETYDLITEIIVEFTTPIVSETFSPEDIQLLLGSESIVIASVVQLTDKTYNVTLNNALAEGQYSLNIGTEIESQFGKYLDQNGNGTSAENDDEFEFDFSVQGIKITEDITLLSDDPSYSGANLIIDGANVTLDGRLNVESLSLVNGAVLTHTAATDQASNGIELNVSDEFFIDASSKITADGKGLVGSSGATRRAGGSYGGYGGKGETDSVVNEPYGSLTEPDDFGTGGKNDNASNDSERGGGKIKLTVNTLKLDGYIYANGIRGHNYAGGGSGGSIWIDADAIIAGDSAKIFAIGASGGTSRNTGGGSGGRIAIYYGTETGLDLTGASKVHAYGNRNGQYGGVGGVGTVYAKQDNMPIGLVRIDNSTYGQSALPAELTGDLNSDLYVDQVNLRLTGETSINSLSGTSSGTVILDGTLIMPNDHVIVDGAYLEVNNPQTWTNVSLINGGRITHGAANDISDNGLNLTITDTLFVDAASRISVDGKGLVGSSDATRRAGGSYGGYGGKGEADSIVNEPYGSLTEPDDFGAGGKNDNASNGSERGGGKIKLAVNTLKLDGYIYANGIRGHNYAGGGSGGSIWIDADAIIAGDSAKIFAIGASGGTSRNTGGGSGGRIAIYYATETGLDLTGASKVHAYGNRNGQYGGVGGVGTVYAKKDGADIGLVRIDNSTYGQSALPTELTGKLNSDLYVDQVYLRLAGETSINSLSGTSTGTVILDGTLIMPDDHVIVDGAYLEVNTPQTWTNVSVINGGRITHGAANDISDNGLNLTITDTLFVDAASRISVDGKGLVGSSDATRRAGGSYGGYGGKGEADSIVNEPYGSLTEPDDFGTGGKNDNASNASERGGGKIKLAANTLQLDGYIYANGIRGHNYAGGGSGGSIWIDARTIVAGDNARVYAVGATGGSSRNTGGGSGGRIAIYYGTETGLDLTGASKVHAYGNRDGQNGGVGGVGTVYAKQDSAAIGLVRIDNSTYGQSALPTELTGNLNSDLYVDQVYLRLTGETSINSLSGTSTGTVILDGTLIMPDDHVIVDGAYLEVNTPQTWTNVSLINGGRITHAAANDQTDNGLDLTVTETLLIDSSSRISVDGKGLVGSSEATGRAGGSYGGYGGQGEADSIVNEPYGSLTEPDDFGTGGKNDNASNASERGGGKIKLTANTIQLDGYIYANGIRGHNYAGGGSGGAIWVDADTIIAGDSARIYAIGAYGGSSRNTGGGSGGRIAIYYGTETGLDLTGASKVHAYGNRNGRSGKVGGVGTVYAKQDNAELGLVRIDNAGYGQYATPTELTGNLSSDLYVDEVTLKLIGETSINSLSGTSKGTVVLDGTLVMPNDHVIVDGTYLEINSPQTWTNVSLINGGRITHAAVTDQTDNGIDLTVTESLFIDSSSRISADGKGLVGADNATRGAGGSYGGYGGKGEADSIVNEPYGSLTEPDDFGTGGKNDDASNGSERGGGKIKLAAGTIQLEGFIYANGIRGHSYAGGGSGGSVWVDADTIIAGDSARIYAIGASGGTSRNTGGGSGGRVAIYYGTETGLNLTGASKVHAYGNRNGRSGKVGGVGTVYAKQDNTEIGFVRINNISNGQSALPTELTGNLGFDLFVDQVYLRLTGETTINSLSGTSTGTVILDGTLAMPNDHVIVNGTYLEVNTPQTWTNASVINGGRISHSAANNDLDNGLELVVSDTLFIDANSQINVNGKGLVGSSIATEGAGGSYGGYGGKGEANSIVNEPYGEIAEPVDFGTGGKNVNASNSSERGGGKAKLTTNTLQLDGNIYANGIRGSSHAGGGSGGSIWIDTGTYIAGDNSVIRAAGAGGGYSKNSGGGSGGRVAIYYGETIPPDVAPEANVNGGSRGRYGEAGQPGTVFLQQVERTNLPIEYQSWQRINAQSPSQADQMNNVLRFNGKYYLNESSSTPVPVLVSDSLDSPFIPSVPSIQLQQSLAMEVLGDELFINHGHGLTKFNGQSISNYSRSHAYAGLDLNLFSESYVVSGLSNGSGNGNAWEIINTDSTPALLRKIDDIGIYGGTSNTIHYGQGMSSHEFNGAIYFGGSLNAAADGYAEGVMPVYRSVNTDISSLQKSDLQFIDVGVSGLRAKSESHQVLFVSNSTHILAVARNLNHYAYSTDGTSWTAKTLPEGRKFAAHQMLSIEDTVIVPVANTEKDQAYLFAFDSEQGELKEASILPSLTSIDENATSLELRSFNQNSTEILLAALVKTSLETDYPVVFSYRTQESVPTRIVSSSLPALTNEDISSFTIGLADAIDALSFTVEDVLVEGPQGTIAVDSVTQRNLFTYEVSLTQALPHGTYTITIGPDIRSNTGEQMDQNENDIAGEASDAFVVTINVDKQAPTPVVITSHDISQVQSLDQRRITLAGSRAENTSVWINNAMWVPVGSDDWVVTNLAQSEGDNTITIVAKDLAGNESSAVTMTTFVDSTPPYIQNAVPAHNEKINSAPAQFTIHFTESGTGIDESSAQFALTRGASVIAGAVSVVENTIQFVPSVGLIDGTYQIEASIADNGGLLSSTWVSTFILDRGVPAKPVVNSLPATVTNATIQLSGNRESGAQILVNDIVAVQSGQSSSWTYNVILSPGENQFRVSQQDPAGNISDVHIVDIFFDDQAPGQVTIVGTNTGTGTSALLNWSGYDEAANGNDIAAYEIYQHSTEFSSTTDAALIHSVQSGQQQFNVETLSKGNTYYFAVIAVDTAGNKNRNVTSIAVTTSDTVAPSNPSSLTVSPTANSATLNWTSPADSDLASFKLYLDAAEVDSVASTVNQFEFTGLSAASSYALKVSSVDSDGNESNGATSTAATLVANPINVQVTAESSKVSLSWDASEPANLISAYRIYRATTAFTSIDGMTPALQVSNTKTTTKLAGLSNGQTYHFAVTAVNISGGEAQSVNTVSATPIADIDGPELGALNWDNILFADGQTIAANGEFSLTASDVSGVARVEFSIDGVSVASDVNGSNGYTFALNINELTDASHTLDIQAVDTLGNESTSTHAFTVAMAPPAAPQITSPETGVKTNKSLVDIMVQSIPGIEIRVFREGEAIVDWMQVGSQGTVNVLANLAEGSNNFTALARNRGGEGAASEQVDVVLDTSLPQTPQSVRAEKQDAGQILITWQNNFDDVTVGYDVYRSNQPFTQLIEAEKINNSIITKTSHTDIPLQDGTYYYGVIAINEIDTASEPSNIASATSDNTAPYADAILYTAKGAYDGVNGIYGRGDIDLLLQLNEPLLTTPFLTIVPEGGVPMTVTLQKNHDTEYAGTIFVPNGIALTDAYANFSGRDLSGNRGTEIHTGQLIQIDTRGPHVEAFSVFPESPILNTAEVPTQVTVSFTLDEAVKSNTLPALSYLLSGSGRALTPIENIAPVVDNQWQAQFTLPADAGSAEIEQLSFEYSATDTLDNVSTSLPNIGTIQVYQGDLPPLPAPFSLRVTAGPNGTANLVWYDVPSATEYLLFRKGPGESELSELIRVAEGVEYIDQTSLDGEYEYAVSSVRQQNGQEAISFQSNIAAVTTDSVAPDAPANLTSQLYPEGIGLTWNAVNDIDHYRLYRDSQTEITDVSNLDIVIDNIGSIQALDQSPDENKPGYVVTAVDSAGNESTPSNTQYLNVDLLPVSTLTIDRTNSASPILRWTHSSQSLAGFDLYLGDKATGYKLTETPQAASYYTDFGYTPSARTYTVVAVDNNGIESLARSITLPNVEVSKTNTQPLKRNVMNRVSYTVTNNGATAIPNAVLHVTVAGHTSKSVSFALQPAESQDVNVIVGGFADLPSAATLVTKLEIKPRDSETINLTSQYPVNVIDGSLLVTIETQEFTRGAEGQIRFILENTSEENIEIQTGRSGDRNSADISYKLYDSDGNVLTTGSFKQNVGEQVVTTATGDTIARIVPGERFTSDLQAINVPASATETITAEVNIKHFYYDYGASTQIKMGGNSTRKSLSIVETPYYAEIISISPENSFGDETINIQARLLNRADNQALKNAPALLTIKINGFERRFDLYSDDNGIVSYDYVAQSGESGLYHIAITHPEVTDLPDMGQFVISKLTMSPNDIRVAVPRNYTQVLPVKLKAGKGTQLNNVNVRYAAISQTSGELIEGLTITLPDALTVGSDQTVNIPISFVADDNAPESGEFIIDVLADESAERVLTSAKVAFELSEALPILSYSPTHIETGVTLTGKSNESITLSNKGIDKLRDVQVQLLRPDDTLAPDWATLTSPQSIGDLDVGQTRELGLVFQPENRTFAGIHQFKLKIDAANHPTREIGISVAATESGIGKALFKLADIYTATLDDRGLPIQGLANATVRLQNEDVPTQTYSLKSDALGEAFFDDIPAGRYSYWVSAKNHQESHGRFRIKPGVVTSEYVFVDYNLITVEWAVNEITINDRYEIVLRATFETDVPAAVVVMEPSSITLPDMVAGDVFFGELSITNHGLVRADNLTFNFPESDEFFHYEFLTSALPETLAAKEVITLPYRVVSLQALDSSGDGDASGAGCFTFRRCTEVEGDYDCANGDERETGSQSCFVKSYGNCDVFIDNNSTKSSTITLDFGWTGSSDVEYVPPKFNTPDSQEPLPACREDSDDCEGDGNGAGGE